MHDIPLLLENLYIQGYTTLAALSYEARKECPDWKPDDVHEICRRYLRDKHRNHAFGETGRY